MKSKFALRTCTLLLAWLVFENFNLLTADTALHSVLGSHYTGHGAGFLENHTDFHACSTASCGKSMESHAHQLPYATLVARRGVPGPSYRIKTVVLDAGHGGKDPGCIGASAFEKENVLAIVLRLGAYIEANYPNIKVIYTRKTDVFVELNERAAIANRNAADLFISVHCNALPGKAVHGAETYVLGLHRSKDNLEVAKRENASIFLEKDYQKNYGGYDPDSPEAEIFANLWQSAYLEQSIVFASYVQQFANAIAFREDRGVKQAGFLVLRETAMPAVLVETGYLTHHNEEEFLASDEGREQMAVAIFQAFEAYKRHMETGKPAADLPKPVKSAIATAQQNTAAPVKTVAQKVPVSGTASVKTTPEKNQVAASKTIVKETPPAAASYTIFLLAWPNRLDPDVGQLSLLANVKESFKEGKYHYFSGTYATKAEAEKVLPEIQNMGFKSALIVSK